MAGQQKKNRKFDRNRKRSASMATYRAVKRDEQNRRKRIEKDKKDKEKAVLKNSPGGKLSKDGVPRGTKRAKLRKFYRDNPSKKPEKEEKEKVQERGLKFNDAPMKYAHLFGKKGRCVCCNKKKNSLVNEVCLECS